MEAAAIFDENMPVGLFGSNALTYGNSGIQPVHLVDESYSDMILRQITIG